MTMRAEYISEILSFSADHRFMIVGRNNWSKEEKQFYYYMCMGFHESKMILLEAELDAKDI